VAIRIEPYRDEAQAEAARAFNQRLRAHNQTEFLLGEQPPAAEAPDSVIKNHFYLALEEEAIRGGFLLAEFPAQFGNGTQARLLNAREPLSEGIIDSKYSLLALRLLKFMQQQGPYLFALGMGGEDRPFPRLLKSSGWTVRPVPFLFRVVRANRFLSQLRLLRTSTARRLLANVAAITGAGKIGISALQFRSLRPVGGLSIERVSEWGEWVDELWHLCRGQFSFAVLRDLKTVRAMYPLDERARGYVVRRGDKPVGWVAALNTRMNDHKYFGNLTVATILDAIAVEEEMRGVIALASRTLARDGADLLVTNQSHEAWVRAFRGAGYLSARSNYILALSKPLAAEIEAQPGRLARAHFTRGDSDGRIFL
jgi:hypothetical protein